MSKVDDAVADAKASKQTEQQKDGSDGAGANKKELQKNQRHQAAAAVATTTTKSKTHAKGQSFVSYMQSTLKEKPQDKFDVPVDNRNTPFVHCIQHLGGVLAGAGVNMDGLAQDMANAASSGGPVPHPLRHLLDELEYPEWMVGVPEAAHAYRSFEETPYEFVASVEALEAAAARLSKAREIAVDLEAHGYRSFQGFCCLMQLSTREEDLVVDVLALRPHIGRIFAPIFANPSIVKVLHGSDGDIAWLQRDFGIYVCNLFDTGQAARVLNFPGHGLGVLLEQLCDFKADKRWQLADWRIRPLSEEALHYARADTHYLLHCYDRLRQLLSITPPDTIPPQLVIPRPLPPNNPGGALGVVLERSRQISMQLYEKELLREDSFLTLYAKISKNFDDRQLSVFSALYAWRDKVAREQDESLGYIMSRAHLISLSECLPITVAELSRILGRGSPIVQQRAKEVLRVIEQAKEDKDRVGRVGAMRQQWLLDHPPLPPRGHAQAADGKSVVVLPDLAAAAFAAMDSVAAPPPPPPPAAPVVVQDSDIDDDGSPPSPSPRKILSLQPKKTIKPFNRVVSTTSTTTTANARKKPTLSLSGTSSLFGNLLASDHHHYTGSDGKEGANGTALGFGIIPVPKIAQPVEVQQEQEVVVMSASEKRKEVREAMTALATAPPAVPASSQEEEEEMDDFMPLSLSDKYKIQKKRQKKRQNAIEAPKMKKVKKSELDNDQEVALKNRYKELGLEGDDGEEKEEDQVVDYSNAVAQYNMGMVNPHSSKNRSGGGRGGRGGRGGGRGGRGGGRGGGRTSGGGRDGGGGGGGRGGERNEKDKKSGATGTKRFNPYADLDVSALKGGKRSAVHVRSGNRSSGFK